MWSESDSDETETVFSPPPNKRSKTDAEADCEAGPSGEESRPVNKTALFGHFLEMLKIPYPFKTDQS